MTVLSRVISLYALPIFIVGVSLFFFVLTLTYPVLKTTDLLEVRGNLDSYYVHGHTNSKTIVVLMDGQKFWPTVLNKSIASNVLREHGVEVRTYIDPDSTNVPIDGAVKSYGLWVNGRSVESLEAALSRERLFVRVGFPVVAVFCLAAAVFIYRVSKAKFSSQTR